MKRRLAFFSMVLLTFSAVAQDAAPPKFFVIHFTTGPNWDTAVAPHQQKNFADHSANLKRLREEKRVLLGARYGERGMIVVIAADADEARSLLAADKSIEAGVFEATIDEFKPFYDGCVSRK